MKFWSFWILTAVIASTTYFTWVRNTALEPFPMGCDPFGYLQSAQTVRNAWKAGQPLSFDVTTEQSKSLTLAFEASLIPIAEWDEFVAPHAHHFIPESRRMPCQYSPGTGIALAFWEGRESFRSLNLVIVLFFGIIGWLGMVKNIVSGFYFQAAYWSMMSAISQMILIVNGIRSFSISAMLIPLFLTAFFSNFKSGFLTGASVGFSILTRVVHGLWLPIPILVLERKRWVSYLSGAALFGLFPLGLYYLREAGSFFRSTYISHDTQAKWSSWDVFFTQIKLFFWDKLDTYYTWIFVLSLALVLIARPKEKRFLFAPLLGVLINVVYFALHATSSSTYLMASYYLIPSYFLFGWMAYYSIQKRPVHPAFAIGLMLPLLSLPLLEIQGLAGYGPPAFKDPMMSVSADIHDIHIPEELKSPNAWIFSDDTSGTFYYYAKKSAFKSPFASEKAFKFSLKWMSQDPNHKLFLVIDSDRFDSPKRWIEQEGFKLLQKGKVFGFPYFELVKTKRSDRPHS